MFSRLKSRTIDADIVLLISITNLRGIRISHIYFIFN